MCAHWSSGGGGGGGGLGGKAGGGFASVERPGCGGGAIGSSPRSSSARSRAAARSAVDAHLAEQRGLAHPRAVQDLDLKLAREQLVEPSCLFGELFIAVEGHDPGVAPDERKAGLLESRRAVFGEHELATPVVREPAERRVTFADLHILMIAGDRQGGDLGVEERSGPEPFPPLGVVFAAVDEVP
jgi:hypothetical protein